MIVAVAGRRIDASGASSPRFPLANRGMVARQIRSTLERTGATTVVASAACGADLLALQAARSLTLRWRIILPYADDLFLVDSVLDRPGRWAKLYADLVAEARAAGDVIVLQQPRGSDQAFLATNHAILREAQRVAARESPADPAAALTALIVWEGKPRGPDDITAQLLEHMRSVGAHIVEVRTLRGEMRVAE